MRHLCGAPQEAEPVLRAALAYQLDGLHGSGQDLLFVLQALVDAMVTHAPSLPRALSSLLID